MTVREMERTSALNVAVMNAIICCAVWMTMIPFNAIHVRTTIAQGLSNADAKAKTPYACVTTQAVDSAVAWFHIPPVTICSLVW